MKPSNLSSPPQKPAASRSAIRPASPSTSPRTNTGQTLPATHRATPIQPSLAPAHRATGPKSAPPAFCPPLSVAQAPIQPKLNTPSTKPFSPVVSQKAPPVFRPQTPAQAKPAAQKIITPGAVIAPRPICGRRGGGAVGRRRRRRCARPARRSQAGGRCHPVAADLSAADGCDRVARAAVARFGRIDSWIEAGGAETALVSVAKALAKQLGEREASGSPGRLRPADRQGRARRAAPGQG